MSNNFSIIPSPVNAGPTVQDDKNYQKMGQYFRKNYTYYPLYRNLSVPKQITENLFDFQTDYGGNSGPPVYLISINKDYVNKILNNLPIDNMEDLMKDDTIYISFKFSRMVNDVIILYIQFGTKDDQGTLNVYEHSQFEITNQENCPLFDYIHLNQCFQLEYDKRDNNGDGILYQGLEDVQSIQLQNIEDNNIFLYKLFKTIHMKFNLGEMKKTNESIQSLIKKNLKIRKISL